MMHMVLILADYKTSNSTIETGQAFQNNFIMSVYLSLAWTI